MKRAQRFFLVIFLCYTLIAISLALTGFKKGFNFNTNLVALLPKTASSQVTQQADEQLSAQLGRRVLLVLTASDRSQLLAAGGDLQRLLCAADANAPARCINPDQSSASQPLVELLTEYRFFLLNEQQKQLIKQQPEQLIEQALKRLYGSGQWASVVAFEKDPLGLFNGYIEALSEQLLPFKQYQGMSVITDEQGEERALAFFLELKKDAYNLEYQNVFMAWFDHEREQFHSTHPEVDLLVSGVIFHAAEAASHARQEIAVITTVSVIGIVLLFLICFRSLQPLMAGLTSLAFGCFSAIAATHFFIGELHLITLVFGASLIGVSIDYALHFFSEKTFNGDRHSSLSGLGAFRNIFPAISLGLITSLIGYGILIQAPLPGLKQIALFSVTGLLSAWLAVVALFPLLPRASQSEPAMPIVMIANSFVRLWSWLGRKNSLLIAAALFFFSIATVSQLVKTSDSVRTLYKPSAELLAEEQQIQQYVNSMAANQYFIIRAESQDGLLLREQQLGEQLAGLQRDSQLDGYISNSLFIPDAASQRSNIELLSERVYQSGGLLAQFLARLGDDGSLHSAMQQQLVAAKASPLDIVALHDSLPEELRALYLGQVDGSHVSLVLLRGLHSLKDINQLELPEGVEFYDKVKEISLALKSQQILALKQLFVGYMIIGLLVILRYRYLPALGLIVIPVISSMVTLAILCLMGTALSLFHVFALFLILGLGMDYAIFLFDARHSSASSEIAVLLSALTSCLSFGLLSLSSTPMIAAFGLTILLGSLLNFALAPLVIYCRRP